MRLFTFFLSISFSLACGGGSNTPNNSVNSRVNAVNTAGAKPAAELPVYGYEIVKSYPHDSNSFTQGLVFHDGSLYESSGEYGESSLRKVDLLTGKVQQKHDIPSEFFGEGMTVFNGKAYQITWRERTAFVYNLADFKLERELRYAGEGWGLTHDGANLIMSDGTHVIRFVNPENFQTVRTIVVKRENGQPLMNLNELEYVKGEIWANIWHSEKPETLGKPNRIARIDPATGNLLGWIDLDGISPDDLRRDSENTLNGIAYDAASDRMFVTGKKWKKLFEIKLTPPKAQ